MAAIVHSDKAKKAIKKIKEAMQDYPLGIEFGELMQKTGYAKSSLYSALSLVGAHKSDDGLWHLPGSQNVVAPVNETAEDDLDDNLDDLATAIDQPVKQDDGGNMQDNGGNMQDAPVNMQDEELNTQDPHVRYHDNDVATLINTPATLINTSATLINTSATLINTSAEVVSPSDIDTDADQSSNGQAIETVPVAENEEEFELQPPPIATKHYVLIENCTLSLAKDGTGQEPVLAKDIWVDDEGEELEESDCLVMKRARMPFINEVEFRGVTYRNLFIINNAQIFHGVFNSIKAAHDKMEELTAKKRGNFFEVIEV